MYDQRIPLGAHAERRTEFMMTGIISERGRGRGFFSRGISVSGSDAVSERKTRRDQTSRDATRVSEFHKSRAHSLAAGSPRSRAFVGISLVRVIVTH